MTIKRMDIREFKKAGYLQEANRRFFHPLGLALAVGWEEDASAAGCYRITGVQDCRDDPEGMVFAPEVLATPEAQAMAERIAEEWEAKAKTRWAHLDFGIQPIG